MNTKNKATQTTEETLRFLDNILGPATFGNTIQAIRLADELTQKEFSKKLDISAQQLSDIENERRRVSPEKASLFAKKLGYLVEDFVQLAIQDMLAKVGMKSWDVTLTKRKKKKKRVLPTRTRAR